MCCCIVKRKTAVDGGSTGIRAFPQHVIDSMLPSFLACDVQGRSTQHVLCIEPFIAPGFKALA